MRKIINLFLNPETIKYIFFGVLATVVSIGSYWVSSQLLFRLLSSRDEAVMCANVISWVVTVAFAYFTNKLWVFESKSWKANVLAKEIPAFVGARLFSFGFEMAWMWITAIMLGFNDKLCKILAQFAIVVMNYVFSKLFIFKKKEI